MNCAAMLTLLLLLLLGGKLSHPLCGSSSREDHDAERLGDLWIFVYSFSPHCPIEFFLLCDEKEPIFSRLFGVKLLINFSFSLQDLSLVLRFSALTPFVLESTF